MACPRSMSTSKTRWRTRARGQAPRVLPRDGLLPLRVFIPASMGSSVGASAGAALADARRHAAHGEPRRRAVGAAHAADGRAARPAPRAGLAQPRHAGLPQCGVRRLDAEVEAVAVCCAGRRRGVARARQRERESMWCDESQNRAASGVCVVCACVCDCDLRVGSVGASGVWSGACGPWLN